MRVRQKKRQMEVLLQGKVIQAYNSSTRETSSQAGLHSKFKANLYYGMRLYLKEQEFNNICIGETSIYY